MPMDIQLSPLIICSPLSCSKGTPAAGSSSSRSKARAGAAGTTSSNSGTEEVEGIKVLRQRIGQFLQHADETNDIFRVAAQVIAMTMLQANALLRQQQEQQQEQVPGEQAGAAAAAEKASGAAAAAACGESGPPRPRLAVTSGTGQSQTSDATAVDRALRYVLLPWAAAHKAVWWEAVAVPEEEEEVEFRAQLRELASDSLELLQGAFPETPFSLLFDLQVSGRYNLAGSLGSWELGSCCG